MLARKKKVIITLWFAEDSSGSVLKARYLLTLKGVRQKELDISVGTEQSSGASAVASLNGETLQYVARYWDFV